MSNRRKGMGGAIKEIVAYTPRISREEKDQQILTCCVCGEQKVAKGNFYFTSTSSWNKRYQKYYRTDFYNRNCIPCANALSRKRSKDMPEEHRQIVRRSWRRLHAKKESTRAKVFPGGTREL